MHPLLSSRLRFAVYMAGWLLLGVMFAGVQRLSDGRPWSQALLLILPLMLVYASICLSAFWTCRAMPLDRTPPLQLITSLVVSSLVASVVWASVAGVWRTVLVNHG